MSRIPGGARFAARRIVPLVLVAGLVGLAGLLGRVVPGDDQSQSALAAEPQKPASRADAELTAAREQMVEKEIVAAGVKNQRVIDAVRNTQRHEFVPMAERQNSYLDMALPIGDSQTISPPFMVAYMTEQLDPKPGDKVLEIGTGSGYQAAILSPLVKDVYTIEIVKPLGERAARTLKRLGYKNISTRIGDGFQGWPEAAPFDKIVVTCSPESVPQALIDQLKEGGRMVVPVGERYRQTLYVFEKKGGGLTALARLPTLFVPMTGQAEEQRNVKPDPANPKVNNGNFEEALDGQPAGWHYQRQLNWVASDAAPEGKHYITFHNDASGRGAQCLQGLAVDGRQVSELVLSARVKAKDIRTGRNGDDEALVGIQFYDADRAPLSYNYLGPWRGTFDWRQDKENIRVPPAAREAILIAGLRGATGELSLDDVQLTRKAGKQPAAKPAAKD